MEIDFTGLDEISEKELEETAFFVDFLPKTLKTGAMFVMNGLTMLHIKNGYCMLVKFTDELDVVLPEA
jgi:hypothetical protein